MSKKEEKQDIKIIKTKPDRKSKKEDKRDIEMMKIEPDIDKVTHEEEKAALILGITSVFTVWWIDLQYSVKLRKDTLRFHLRYLVNYVRYQKSV